MREFRIFRVNPLAVRGSILELNVLECIFFFLFKDFTHLQVLFPIYMKLLTIFSYGKLEPHLLPIT